MSDIAPFGVREVATFLDGVVDLSGPPGAPAFGDVLVGLSGLGLPPGTVVIIAMSNGRPLLSLYFAALLSGLVPMPVSPATPSARIARLADEVGAGAVLASCLDPRRYGADRAVPVGGAVAVVLPSSAVREPGTVLMLTSGTSGMFSACVHRVGSLVRNARRHATAVGLCGTDTVLVNLPLYYSYAIVAQALAALGADARLVVSGPPFSPAGYRAIVAEHGVTASALTPTIIRLLLAQGGRLPAGLRLLTVGGDRIDPAHVGALLATNPALELYLTYGLAEAGPRVSTLAAHAEPARRHGSVGLPLPGVTAALRPALGHQDAAELVVSSDTVLVEKIGGLPEDRRLIRPGVVATGDLFRIDGDGYLYFAGRLSDFVVVRGEKVSLYSVRQFVQSLDGTVRCTTSVGADAAGETYYDLDVQITADIADLEQAQRRIRRAVLSYLLPAERPRSLQVGYADLAVFQK